MNNARQMGVHTTKTIVERIYLDILIERTRKFVVFIFLLTRSINLKGSNTFTLIVG